MEIPSISSNDKSNKCKLCLQANSPYSYTRNINTLGELNKREFEIVQADDVTSGRFEMEMSGKCVVTLDGSELPRGDGIQDA